MLATALHILFMLLATHGAPIVAARLFRSHGDLAVDLGRQWPDGLPVFGTSKTWRGVVAATGTACIVGMALGYPAWFGLVFGALAMLGDLFSSFVKRRRGLQPSDQSLGWDQLPESLLPALFGVLALGAPWWGAVPVSAAFMVTEMLISIPLYRLKIRKRPY